MKWNLRLVAAQRDIWKASELQRMLAEAGLTISAGKMSGLWSGQPVTIRLDDLDVICDVLSCTPADLLIPEPDKAAARRPDTDASVVSPAAAAAGQEPIVRRHIGRLQPPR
ncbi:helix-turn-helix domain-containing protein [Streptomyces scabiei]|uniref:helix-turn-helix domain-containing protein n=1 Tax=Streptomyces scabiei TaxID=1930 RepID=UPI0038F5EDDC